MGKGKGGGTNFSGRLVMLACCTCGISDDRRSLISISKGGKRERKRERGWGWGWGCVIFQRSIIWLGSTKSESSELNAMRWQLCA